MSRREFLQGVAVLLLPHHRPWHKPKPSPSPSPSPSPVPSPTPEPSPPPSGVSFVVGLSALRDGALLRA